MARWEMRTLVEQHLPAELVFSLTPELVLRHATGMACGALSARHRIARCLIGYDPVAMPRYFFIIAYTDREIDDPDGTLLPSDTTAIEYARRVMDEIREDCRQEDPGTDHHREERCGRGRLSFPQQLRAVQMSGRPAALDRHRSAAGA